MAMHDQGVIWEFIYFLLCASTREVLLFVREDQVKTTMGKQGNKFATRARMDVGAFTSTYFPGIGLSYADLNDERVLHQILRVFFGLSVWTGGGAD